MARGFTIRNVFPLIKRIYLRIALMAIFLIHTVFIVHARAESTALSLAEAFSNALSKNRTIAYYDIEKENAEIELGSQRSIYIPQFDLMGRWDQYSWKSDNINSYSWMEMPRLTASIQRKNSYGGVSSLNFSTQKDKTVYDLPTAQEIEYRSSIFIKYEQPLLRGRGEAVTNFEINKSALALELARQRYEDNKNAVLFNVFRDYFSLFLTVEELRVKNEIRENTQAIFDVVKEKVEMRRLPVTDQNKMQTVLYIRDREILEIENLMRQKKNQLMLSMFSNVDYNKDKDYRLTTSIDEIIKGFRQPDPSDITAKAEGMDLELIGYENDFQRYGLELFKARDDLKPELTGAIELGADGYDAERWLGSATDISPGNYRILLSGTLKFPVKNTMARSKVRLAENRIRQVEIQRENRIQEVRNYISELYDDLETVKRKVELSEEITSISKQNLDYEIERLVAEKTTVLNTLDYQTSLINAELDMIANKLDYIILIGVCRLYQREMETFANNQ